MKTAAVWRCGGGLV